MIETNRIEFKRELTPDLDLEKEVVAFLNYHEGGMIYIGIDDDGLPVGVKDIDGDMLKIKDRIRTGISPSPMGLFDVKVEEIDNISVIKIFIASGSDKPYYKTRYGLSEKGCFMRVGTAAEPMTNEQIEDLFSRKVHNTLKNVVSPRQDLTFVQLKIYYTEKGFQLNDNFIRSLDLMTDDGKYNYVAYLLADENGNSMKLAKYAGAGSLVPITGFANSVAAPAIEFQKEGQVFGIGCKIFTIAGPVILYGIFASWLLGLGYWVLKCFGIV